MPPLADGIVLVNRVKPHVSFRGKHESGLMKMIAIGLGKQKGAEACHQLGMERMLDNIVAIRRKALSTGKILFGVALVENAYHETCRIEAIPSDRIESRGNRPCRRSQAPGAADPLRSAGRPHHR